MTNQSFVSLQPDIEDPEVLRRTLSLIIEKVDIILGNRGNAGYISTADIDLDNEETDAAIAEIIRVNNAQTVQIQQLQSDIFVLKSQSAIEATWVKGWFVDFIGRASNGAITMAQDLNISSGQRVAVGTYEFTLAQTTIDGVDILTEVSPAISHTIANLVTSELFSVEYTTVGAAADSFRVLVNELVITAGVITKNLIDPITAGDTIVVAGLMDASGAIASE